METSATPYDVPNHVQRANHSLHGFNISGYQSLRMTDDETTEETPAFLSSLPDRPITDDIIRQIGESDHPKIRGAMGLPGSEPGKTDVFQLDLTTKTYVLVFDPTAEQWRVYDSFETDGMSHEEIIDRAAEIANEWLAESLSDRIAAMDDSASDT